MKEAVTFQRLHTDRGEDDEESRKEITSNHISRYKEETEIFFFWYFHELISILNNSVLFGWVAVAEWLARPSAKQEVCGSNPASYLCWNIHVGKVTGCYAGYIHRQRCRTRGETQGTYITYTSTKFE